MATRNRPSSSPPHSHETLMGSMMARSTPRVLFYSPIVRHIVTALEVLSALHAFALFITLCFLHVRFVRRDGCAVLLTQCDSQFLHHRSQVAPIIELAVTSADRPYYRFSQERGLLLLSDKILNALNVSVTRIDLPTNHACLGDRISRFIFMHLVGYDSVATNAFASLRRRIKGGDCDGYVLTMHTRRVLNLLHADNMSKSLSNRFMRKCGAIVTAVFILCTTAALVAFTLREVQLRMIKLTIDLQVIMRSQIGYGRVIVRYATDALVFVPIIAGMLFFLFEFFDDQALAFAVLIITWLCEFAASGSTRHWISRLYLPRLFFFYFVAFHIYFFSFPLGFSWLSFATSLAFMVHAALAVWNHCELPLLRNEHNLQPHWT